MEKVFGIDISSYQAGINLERAKNEGVRFAILRAGFTGWGGAGTGKNKDSQFENFYSKCKALGIGVGAYWYSCANTYDKGKAEAEYLYNNCLKGKQFEYPIYIDVEDSHHQQPAGRNAITQAIKGFCEYIEAKGFYVGIYANSYWFNTYINQNEVSRYDKWVANWGTSNPSTPSHGMWQFGGETNKVRTNKVAGVTCDQDYSFYDYPGIIKNKKLNGYSSSTPSTPSTSPTPSQSSTNMKYKVGDKVKFTGTLYRDSAGNGAGQSRTNLDATIYLVNPGSKCPYNINNGLGWVREQDLNPTNNNTSSARYHTVVSGDTLWGIAQKYYGNGNRYPEIARANNIANPNVIRVGQRLLIP